MSGTIDWSQLITKAMKDAEAAAATRAAEVLVEEAWRVKECAFIADQLIGMEDGDPAALPGTETEWRAYRTKVRSWKEGAQFFPDQIHRPIRPA
jgi:hypothetical protein